MASLNFEITRPPQSYYAQVLHLVSGCLAVGATYQQIADALNSANLRTPTGLSFGPQQVTNLLRQIRNPAKYPNRFSNALKGIQ